MPNTQRKFLTDTAANLFSTAILAVGGMLFNLVIVFRYSPDTLGIFSLSYSYYILLSQLAVCGLHLAVAKFTAEYADEPALQNRRLVAAMLCALGFSAVLLAILFPILFYQGMQNNVTIALLYAAPGLPFFAQNKVLLGYFNGKQNMKLYALFQSLREIFIVLSIAVLAAIGAPGIVLTLAFFISETLLFIIMLTVLCLSGGISLQPDFSFIPRLLNFGFKIMPGNLILEFNTKIDIICLGLLTSDEHMVGIYAFAALFCEGFYQLFVVVRRIISPRITQAFYAREAYTKQAILTVRRLAPFFGLCAAFAVLVFYYAFCRIPKQGEYILGFLPLVILLVSISLNGKSVVLGSFLSATGRPFFESVTNIAAAATNLIFNLALIPFFGIVGAAAATGVSYFVFSITQGYFINKYYGECLN